MFSGRKTAQKGWQILEKNISAFSEESKIDLQVSARFFYELTKIEPDTRGVLWKRYS